MKKSIKAHIIFLFTLLVCVKGFTQEMVNASVTTTSFHIGDPVQLRIQAVAPVGTSIVLPSIDSIPQMEIIGAASIDSVITTNNLRKELTLSFTVFDTGTFTIPSYSILLNGRSFNTYPVEIKVSFMPIDVSGDYKDIHAIEAVPPPEGNFWWWFALASVIVLAVILWLTSRKKKEAPAKRVVITKTPYEEALLQLKKLREIEQPGAMEYAGLINILRTYLVRTRNFPATGQTYFHLLKFVQQYKMPLEHLQSLDRTLQAATFSLFARKEHSSGQWVNDVNSISNIIIQLNANQV